MTATVGEYVATERSIVDDRGECGVGFAGLLMTLVVLLLYRETRRPVGFLPGPPAVPIIGNVLASIVALFEPYFLPFTYRECIVALM